MKKLLLSFIAFSATTTMAMTTVDFNSALYKDPTTFTCNGKKITPQTTINNLLLNCKNGKIIEHDEPTPNSAAQMHNANAGSATAYDETDGSSQFTVDVVKFWDDKNSYMTCKFLNGQLKKCKYKLAKATTKPAASQPSTSAGAESTPAN